MTIIQDTLHSLVMPAPLLVCITNALITSKTFLSVVG